MGVDGLDFQQNHRLIYLEQIRRSVRRPEMNNNLNKSTALILTLISFATLRTRVDAAGPGFVGVTVLVTTEADADVDAVGDGPSGCSVALDALSRAHKEG